MRVKCWTYLGSDDYVFEHGTKNTPLSTMCCVIVFSVNDTLQEYCFSQKKFHGIQNSDK